MEMLWIIFPIVEGDEVKDEAGAPLPWFGEKLMTKEIEILTMPMTSETKVMKSLKRLEQKAAEELDDAKEMLEEEKRNPKPKPKVKAKAKPGGKPEEKPEDVLVSLEKEVRRLTKALKRAKHDAETFMRCEVLDTPQTVGDNPTVPSEGASDDEETMSAMQQAIWRNVSTDESLANAADTFAPPDESKEKVALARSRR